MSTAADYREARARADAEKRLAKLRFGQLKHALKPGALAARAAHKAGDAASAAGSGAAAIVRDHPFAVVSVAAGAGLALTAKPVGRFLADEFISIREDRQ